MEDNVSEIEKKERKRILTEILKQTAFENNQKYIGEKVKVLIEKKKTSPSNKCIYLGKTETYKNIRINLSTSQSVKVGEFLKVKVTGAGIFGLEGIML